MEATGEYSSGYFHKQWRHLRFKGTSSLAPFSVDSLPLILALDWVVFTSHTLDLTFYSHFPEQSSLLLLACLGFSDTCRGTPMRTNHSALVQTWQCEGVNIRGQSSASHEWELVGACLTRHPQVHNSAMHSSRLSDAPRRVRPQVPTAVSKHFYFFVVKVT